MKNFGAFFVTFGICGAIAGIGLLVFSNWEGIFALVSGVFVSVFGFMQIKESKNLEQTM